jgi:aminopeptidase
MPKIYTPSRKILAKYADVLVNFALGEGKGIKKGDTVYLVTPEYTKPLMLEIRKAIFKSGGNIVLNYQPDNFDRSNADKDFYAVANKDQLNFFPEKYSKALVEQIDHILVLLAETDKKSLEGIEPSKIMSHERAFRQFRHWYFDKQNAGKLTWTLASYGTPADAKESGQSHKAYWDQIIKACFLDKKNPILEWKKVFKQVEEYRNKLTKLQIQKVHITGPDADLWITIGEKRQWKAGGGNNIPSFEIFTSPDWRGTNGWIKFNQPLYRYGSLIEGIKLEFKNGKVIHSNAKKNEKVLKSMIASLNANKVGEFSLTDKRFSRITHFMAETLYDENMGGPHGNTHIALGSAYEDCYAGDVSKLSKKALGNLGFNDSAVHTDIVSTTPRTVVAYMKNGKEKIIYKNGMFTL